MLGCFPPPPSPAHRFAAALSPFYHPVKVVPAYPVEVVPPRSLNLDFGCHSESAGVSRTPRTKVDLAANTRISMSLDPKDLEAIERLIYKSGDDIVVSVARSFERLEERIEAAEARLYSRLAEIEDRTSAAEDNLTNEIESIREVLR